MMRRMLVRAACKMELQSPRYATGASVSIAQEREGWCRIVGAALTLGQGFQVSQGKTAADNG